MGFEGEDRMDTAMSSRVGRDIFKEVNFSLVTGRFIAFLLNDRNRCVVTVTNSRD
jgi:hypothetical protein